MNKTLNAWLLGTAVLVLAVTAPAEQNILSLEDDDTVYTQPSDSAVPSPSPQEPSPQTCKCSCDPCLCDPCLCKKTSKTPPADARSLEEFSTASPPENSAPQIKYTSTDLRRIARNYRGPAIYVRGMTYHTHLTRDHGFPSHSLQGLTQNDLFKLHGLAHQYGIRDGMMPIPLILAARGTVSHSNPPPSRPLNPPSSSPQNGTLSPTSSFPVFRQGSGCPGGRCNLPQRYRRRR